MTGANQFLFQISILVAMLYKATHDPRSWQFAERVEVKDGYGCLPTGKRVDALFSLPLKVANIDRAHPRRSPR
jgi:hypothetical protein